MPAGVPSRGRSTLTRARSGRLTALEGSRASRYAAHMKLQGHTILVTGGGSGIGLALAQRFAAAGSTVVICGRREEQLAEARRLCPALHPLQADVATAEGREALVEAVTARFPDLDVLVNNAGTQTRLPSIKQPQPWARHAQEIAINLEAPMHLSMLLVPRLLQRSSAAIINVSSGLAFSPIAFMPTYCATKAALHSFTLSLRRQLADTAVAVVEIVPPMVNTDLGGKGLHDDGVPVDEFADHCMKHLEAGDVEFGFGFSETARLASRQQLDQIFAGMNR